MSTFINMKSIMFGYTDQQLSLAKKIFKSYFIFYSTSIEDATKQLFIEKAYDYKNTIKVKQNVTEDKLLSIYCDELLKLVDGKIAKEGRAQRYYQKAKDIRQTLKKEDKLTYNDVKDFTRIIMCLYSACLKSKNPIVDFSFFVEDIKYKEIFKGESKKKIEAKNKLISIDFELPTFGDDRYSKKEFSTVIMGIIYLDLLNEHEEE